MASCLKICFLVPMACKRYHLMVLHVLLPHQHDNFYLPFATKSHCPWSRLPGKPRGCEFRKCAWKSLGNISSIPSCRLQETQGVFSGQKLKKITYCLSMGLLSATYKLWGRYGLAWAIIHTCTMHIHTKNGNNGTHNSTTHLWEQAVYEIVMISSKTKHMFQLLIHSKAKRTT